ncbi:hypothetical protein H0H92_013662 [Tricholoma furcatifolium]|nr:hypothetical protein H0H92_013662 [Tricholoma furcatifolium]
MLPESQAMENEKRSLNGENELVSTNSQAVGLFEEDVDPLYRAKAKILNDAMQEIGMGRYQWYVGRYAQPRHMPVLMPTKGTFHRYWLWLLGG